MSLTWVSVHALGNLLHPPYAGELAAHSGAGAAAVSLAGAHGAHSAAAAAAAAAVRHAACSHHLH